MIQFQEEEEIDIELPLTEEEIQDKYDGKIQKEMSGKTYEVITDLFRGSQNHLCSTFRINNSSQYSIDLIETVFMSTFQLLLVENQLLQKILLAILELLPLPALTKRQVDSCIRQTKA